MKILEKVLDSIIEMSELISIRIIITKPLLNRCSGRHKAGILINFIWLIRKGVKGYPLRSFADGGFFEVIYFSTTSVYVHVIKSE
jgi:hypothetical protein